MSPLRRGRAVGPGRLAGARRPARSRLRLAVGVALRALPRLVAVGGPARARAAAPRRRAVEP
ncbi:hypothetical protein AB0B88_31725, partial [Micromonospora haikouensis]|uniref:hypothetical protein n=1 Tax=Micromonospora haikouensis TaxID=686309 RepID=UPI0033D41BC4